MEETINPPPPERPTILLVEEDNGARPCLTKNLRSLGYRLLVAADVEDAIEWVSGSYVHADLLLIDLISKMPDEALMIGRGLRSRALYHSQTPLVVMPEKVAKDVEGTDEKVGENDWICYYEDSAQLQRLLVRLLHNPTILTV